MLRGEQGEVLKRIEFVTIQTGAIREAAEELVLPL